MRLGIKTKILAATGLVVMVSLILSGVFAYNYFIKIFKEKAIKDDLTKLDQIAQQMEYQIDDINKLSISIIINQEMQYFVERTQYSNYYEKMIEVKKELDFLANQIYVREYIHSAAVVTSDGEAWYSNLRSPPLDYFKNKLAEPWYQKYRQRKEQFYFSDPYQISNINRGEPTEKVLSSIVQFRSIREPGKVVGELFLNIYVEHFAKYLRLNSRDYDGFYWINREGTVIYSKNYAKSRLKLREILAIPAAGSPKITLVEKPAGYIIINRSLSNGWQLVSFTSKQKLFHRINFILYFFIFFTFISLLLIFTVVLPLILKITNPITELTNGMKQVAAGNLDVVMDISSGDELETMANGFNRMVKELKKHISESVEYEKTKRKMEYDILLSQINPHFIYNILNTVIYLARKQKNYDIVNLVDSFIRILQDGIRMGGGKLLTTVKQEIEIVNHYVTIQQYRYRDRFELIWQVDDGLMEKLIPKTIIQPLVENALYHGICPKEGPGKIIVAINRVQNDLIITVEDDGVGIEEETIQKLSSGERVYEPESKMRSIGIANIRDRIHYLYGENYGITIENRTGKGTVVTVSIPLDPGRS